MKLSSELFKESYMKRMTEMGGKFDPEALDMELERFLMRSSDRHKSHL